MDLVLTFLVGVFASFLGVMVGSTSLISIPALIALGLPPHVSVATNRLGSLGMLIAGAVKYGKAKKIRWEYCLPLCVLAVIGSYIGSTLLVDANERILEYIIVAVMLVMIPIMLIKKHVGTERRESSQTKRNIGYFLFFLCEIWAGFIGAGAGTVIMFIYMTLFGFTMLEATATHKIPTIVMAVTALIVFGMNGLINYTVGIVLFCGMVTGGYIGSHVGLKKGNAWVKTLFMITIVALAIKMILGL